MIGPRLHGKNTKSGGPETTQFPDKPGDPSCWVAPPAAYPPGNTSEFPHIQALNYSKPNGG